jgi:hypothetical protein
VRLYRVAVIVALLLLTLTSTSLAEYHPEDDMHVSVTLLPGTAPSFAWLGDLTFEQQESVHDSGTALTGTSVDHFYIWVEVNGESWLAVDPMSTYEFD